MLNLNYQLIEQFLLNNMKPKSKTLQEQIDEYNELSRQAGTLIPEEEWKATLKELGTFSATRSNFGKRSKGERKESVLDTSKK